MKLKYSIYFPLVFLAVFFFSICSPVFLKGLLPIPADTIVGLYHPWRDNLVNSYPMGVPFKNFLITDPVRQQYPWRELAIDLVKNGQLPIWNPYSAAGTPLLANPQTAFFYPLNILLLLFPFYLGWTIQIMLQVVLGGLFMWLYFRHLKLHPISQTIGVLAWVGSGFFTAWMEWNTLVQVAVWLPFILLCVDKIFETNAFRWRFLFIYSVASSFFAGHVQIFFYVALLTFAYIGNKLLQTRSISKALMFLILFLFIIVITAIQWLPTLNLLTVSARSLPGNSWKELGWFLPWQNLVQFFAPDFFGNPATLNYFGVWNYGEFIGYIGIVPLIFALYAIFSLNRKIIFWLLILVVCLVFSLPNIAARIPFELNLPFLNSFQPTRLIVLIDFSLSILAAFGLEYYLTKENRRTKFVLPLIFMTAVITTLWLFAARLNLAVSSNNLVLPTILLMLAAAILIVNRKISYSMLLILTVLDLSRFNLKFESFSDKRWLFPRTKIIDFLQEKGSHDIFRVAILDDRILPPNFSIHYKIQSIDGYDSYFLSNYLELFNKPGNRIITPKNYESNAFNLLNVRYFLTFDSITNSDYQLVFQEGKTKVYEKVNSMPRTYFSGRRGQARIQKYSANEVIISAENEKADTLILSDAYYPGWKVEIDGRPSKIELINNFSRGVVVPAGLHVVRFAI